jgi:hypothetical protein
MEMNISYGCLEKIAMENKGKVTYPSIKPRTATEETGCEKRKETHQKNEPIRATSVQWTGQGKYDRHKGIPPER